MTVHDFSVDLKYSMEERSFWDVIYKTAFPIMLGLVDCSSDMTMQSAGIDTIVKLPFGAKLYIDEKKRKKNYGDILIEYISNDTKNSPGWIEKTLQIDFIAYAIMDIQTVWFIPFLELQRLWFENKTEWLKTYPLKTAKNKYYNTLNIAIPLKELSAIRIIKVSV